MIRIGLGDTLYYSYNNEPPKYMIRIGLWDTLYYRYNKQPQNTIGNY